MSSKTLCLDDESFLSTSIHKDPVLSDFYQEFRIKAESVPLLPWRWRWADVRVSLSRSSKGFPCETKFHFVQFFSALWAGTVLVRGSRETLGKGSLCERAALAIANQVSATVQCVHCTVVVPRSQKSPPVETGESPLLTGEYWGIFCSYYRGIFEGKSQIKSLRLAKIEFSLFSSRPR